jgi:hypothetical protein
MNKITIEHKYNIGDEVYFFDRYTFKIKRGKIDYMSASIDFYQDVSKRKKVLQYEVLCDNCRVHDMYENSLFPSIEEVAKSLYEGE